MSESFSLGRTIAAAVSRENEPATFLPLLRELFPQIAARANRLSAGNLMLRDELEVAAALGVYEALGKYDPSRGASLSIFARSYAMNRIIDELRSQRRLEAHFENTTIPSSKVSPDKPENLTDEMDSACYASPACDQASNDPLEAIADLERRDAVRRFLDALPVRLREVGRAYFLRGLKQSEVAREFHLSRMSVSNYVKAIVKRAANCPALQVYDEAA